MAQLPPALSSGSVAEGRIPRAAREEERRQQVLAACTDVFAKRGYQAATVENLIAGARISMGGFYKFFEGKEDCFVQVFDRVVAIARERIRLAVPADANWAAQATLGTRALIDFIAEQPLAAKIVVLEAQTGGEEALRRYGTTVREVSAFLRRGREEWKSGERLPENFEDSTASGLVWLLQTRLARGDLGDAEELYPQVVKVVLEPYLGRDRAERMLRAASDEHAASR
ncbi:MAG: TetR/AcrR family transcriptional regulator [Solirubrobacterales bacterium]